MLVDLLDQAYKLQHAGESFAVATVVRVDKPISAKPGDRAIIKSDGALDGWIGGGCAQDTVVREAKKVIRDGQPRFLRLRGRGATSVEPEEGVLEFPITCHSGGTLEIYIEPVLPRPQLVLLGSSPVAVTLAKLVKVLGWRVDVRDPFATREQFPEADSVSDTVDASAIPHGPLTFVVVATQGHDDEPALMAAATSDAPYVAFVASRRKFESRLDYLRDQSVSEERIARIKAPAGLDIGAVTPDEIAASILAELIEVRRRHWTPQAAAAAQAVAAAESIVSEAVDPICGMMVETATAHYVVERDGQKYYFCSYSCKEQFEQSPRSKHAVEDAG